jgi:RNA polymerase sigma-70 factor (ECF subfamily)
LWCIAAAVLGDRDQAEDVVQEAAVIALRKLDEFDPATAFSAWMGQIVRYLALNQARRKAHPRTIMVDPSHLDETISGEMRAEPAELNSRGELFTGQASFDDRILAALRGIDETARACLLLRTVLDTPYREIARALGIPEGTAMSHVHRARRAMRDMLFATAPVALSRSGDADD